MNNYQKASIIKIYGNDNLSLNDAENFYIKHNSNYNGINIASKLSTVNNKHSISGTRTSPEDNNSYTYLISYDNFNYYKIMSAKDIDYENAYLKYAAYQNSNYNEPFTYTIVKNINDELVPETHLCTDNTYIFDRQITPYINNTYDLINIIDYLLNRFNTFYFLLNIAKDVKQKKESLSINS